MSSLSPHLDVVPLHPLDILRRLWGHRGLIRQLVGREVQQRYRGSWGGLSWSFLTPLLMLAVYTVVFSFVFEGRFRPPPDPATASAEGAAAAAGHAGGVGEFALMLFAGLIPFNVFSEVVQRSPTLVLAVPNYVKRVVFPLEVLTVTALGHALVTAAVSTAVLVLGVAALLHTLSWTIVFLPLVLLPLVLLTAGASWLLAAVGTYVRDIGQFVGVAVQALIFLTPVFWPPHRAPGFLQPLIVANPLAAVVEGFRACAVLGELPDFATLGVWTAVTGAFAWLGYVFFAYVKRGFADVL